MRVQSRDHGKGVEMSVAINIRDVSVSIKGKDILKNINISLEEGHFLGIVGPNGGGKTTLVKSHTRPYQTDFRLSIHFWRFS